jgi:CubicO group peptidase (beta-lactamase class C family)
MFYQALLRNTGDLWGGATLADATGTVRNTFADPLTGVKANRALGVILAGDDGLAHIRGGFGKTQSPGAFGHPGAGGQLAWADPATGVSLAYLTNGLDRHLIREARRGVGISSRAGLLTAAGDA